MNESGTISVPTQTTIHISIEPLLLSREAAAAALDLDPSTLDRHERAGRIGPRPIKLGARVFYRPGDLKAWVDAGLPGRVEWDSRQEDEDSRIG